MKRFLILFILTVFLAIPAISSARVVTGGGVAPTFTLQVNSIHNNPSVMTTQSFAFTKGALFFNVSSVDNPDGGDASKMQHFNAAVSFAGSASSTALSKTTTIGNISMNLDGLVISADKTPSAAIGSGTVNGTFNLTDGTLDDSGNPVVQNMSFKGSYSMKVALSGFVSDGQGGTIPTAGTATFTVIISRVGPEGLAPIPNFNNTSSIMTNQISPQPVVVNATLGATPFKLGSAGVIPIPTGTADVHGTWNGIHAKSDLTDGGPMSLNLVQTGTVLTGTIGGGGDKGSNSLTGSVVGNTVTLQFTDNSGSTATITGALNADKTLSGTYKSTGYAGQNPETGKWGAAKNGATPTTLTGAWNGTHTSTMGKESGPFTIYLGHYGSTYLGWEPNENAGQDPSQNSDLGIGVVVSGTSITLTMLDGGGGKITAIGSTLTMSGSYSDVRSGVLDDKGNWNVQKAISFALYHTPDGGSPQGPAVVTLVQNGTDLTGTLDDGNGHVNSVTGTIGGDGSFSMSFTDGDGYTTTVIGNVTSGTFGTIGAAMSGTYSSDSGETGTWNATEN